MENLYSDIFFLRLLHFKNWLGCNFLSPFSLLHSTKSALFGESVSSVLVETLECWAMHTTKNNCGSEDEWRGYKWSRFHYGINFIFDSNNDVLTHKIKRKRQTKRERTTQMPLTTATKYFQWINSFMKSCSFSFFLCVRLLSEQLFLSGLHSLCVYLCANILLFFILHFLFGAFTVIWLKCSYLQHFMVRIKNQVRTHKCTRNAHICSLMCTNNNLIEWKMCAIFTLTCKKREPKHTYTSQSQRAKERKSEQTIEWLSLFPAPLLIFVGLLKPTSTKQSQIENNNNKTAAALNRMGEETTK